MRNAVKQFEYDLVIVEIDKNYLECLNHRGQQGWQIVAQHDHNGHSYFITFMREKTQR